MINTAIKNKTLFISLVLLLFISCEKEEIDKGYTGDAIWENQFYFGNTAINGTSIVTSEIETANNHIKDKVCYSDLPSSTFSTWSFDVYIPSNNELTSGFDINGTTIYYNGASLEINNSDVWLAYEGEEMLYGNKYSIFSVEIEIPNNNVNAENFQAMYFGFEMTHDDKETDEEVNSDGKFIQVDFSNC